MTDTHPKIERWTRDAKGFVKWPEGEWVRYTDYIAALETAERERDCYKRRTRNCIGFTYEKTGERATIYAEDRRSIEILLYEPGIAETFRDIEQQIKDGRARTLSPGEIDRDDAGGAEP